MRIAFAGNPNSGKTTMFNALTGRNETVGNWAGVTVDKKEAPMKRVYTGGADIVAVFITFVAIAWVVSQVAANSMIKKR